MPGTNITVAGQPGDFVVVTHRRVAGSQNMFVRARALDAAVGESAPDAEEMHTALDLVLAEDPQSWTPATGGVTLWRSEFDCAQARMTVRFLLGVTPAGRRYSSDVVISAS